MVYMQEYSKCTYQCHCQGNTHTHASYEKHWKA